MKLQGGEGMEDSMEEVKEEVGEVVPTLTVEERMEQGEAKNGVVEPEAAKVEVKVEPGGEEEEDPVIHEIPVFLSKGIDKLMLFQVLLVVVVLVVLVHDEIWRKFYKKTLIRKKTPFESQFRVLKYNGKRRGWSMVHPEAEYSGPS